MTPRIGPGRLLILLACALTLGSVLAPWEGAARVLRLEIDSRETYAGGIEFRERGGL